MLPLFRRSLTQLGNRTFEVSDVAGRAQQMDRLHQAVEIVLRHDDGVRRVTAHDEGHVGIVDDLIDQRLQIAARIREMNGTQRIALPVLWLVQAF